jgi:hypothetical protein
MNLQRSAQMSCTRTVITLPPEFDVVEKEGQPSWLFAAEERLQRNRKTERHWVVMAARDSRVRRESRPSFNNRKIQ